jgi:hypothetical protein
MLLPCTLPPESRGKFPWLLREREKHPHASLTFKSATRCYLSPHFGNNLPIANERRQSWCRAFAGSYIVHVLLPSSWSCEELVFAIESAQRRDQFFNDPHHSWMVVPSSLSCRKLAFAAEREDTETHRFIGLGIYLCGNTLCGGMGI